MDKAKIGSFIATLRKEKGMTQKELADKLVISDKAVSKWERGISFPDITLLEPLSIILEVSITELVKGDRISMSEKTNTSDEVMQAALNINSESNKSTRKYIFKLRTISIIAITLVACLECILLFFLKVDMEKASIHLWTVEGLAIFFGLYFWLVAKEKIPIYYDENKISFYTDGFIKMNIPGVHFNNSNWPHIVSVIRIWSVVVMILYPIATWLLDRLPINGLAYLPIVFLAVFSIFIPIVYVGKKYE